MPTRLLPRPLTFIVLCVVVVCCEVFEAPWRVNGRVSEEAAAASELAAIPVRGSVHTPFPCPATFPTVWGTALCVPNLNLPQSWAAVRASVLRRLKACCSNQQSTTSSTPPDLNKQPKATLYTNPFSSTLFHTPTTQPS